MDVAPIERILAFGTAIWSNWPTIAVGGIIGVIASFIAGRSAKMQKRLGLLRISLEWIGNNKALFTLGCVFFAFIWASFSAFDIERRAKETALSAQNKPLLDPSMIYQDGLPAAYAAQARPDPSNNGISFGIVTAAHELDMSKIFEYHEWKLFCQGQADGMMSFGAMVQINYLNFACRIQGLR
jgi:hypothetical protein